MKVLKKLSLATITFAMITGLCACGSSTYTATNGKGDYAYTASESAYDYSEEYGYDEEYTYSENETSGMSDAENVKDTSRKLIKTYNMYVETEKFDGFTEMVQNKVVQLGGYIENLSTSNGSKYYDSYNKSRYSYMTIRIPVKNTDEFLEMIGDNANITSKTLSVEDVTLSYVDIESRKDAYLTEQKRLMELLGQAESIEDILTIEDRLTNIRYNIESLESQLRTYDNKVDYTTVYLDVSEVEVYTEPEPESYGQKLAKSFSDGFDGTVKGLQNFLLVLVGAIPGLVVFAVFVLIFILIMFLIIRLIVKKIIKATEKSAAKAQTSSAPVENVQEENEESKEENEE